MKQKPKRGRPKLGPDKRVTVSMRIHPQLLARVRALAAAEGVPWTAFVQRVLAQGVS